MNKILKIIIKKNPIFKYVVEDYPFYEGLFFHSIDFHKMNVLNTRYLLRQRLYISQGNADLIYNPRYLLRLKSGIEISSPELLINPKFKLKSKVKVYISNVSKSYIKLNLRMKMNDKNYSKSTANLHLIKFTRLKTHDPYSLENRDSLSLANMDGKKFL